MVTHWVERSAVTAHLQNLAKSQKNVCVVVAFCRYTDPIPVKDILAAIVRQLLEDYPSTGQFIKPMYEYHKQRGTRPSQSELFELLENISTSGIFLKSFYVLDGLDEAPSDIQIDVLTSLSSLRINFFITSRPLDSLKEIVPTAVFIDIVVQDRDIEILVDQKTTRMPGLRKLLMIDGWRDKVISKILEKSSGMMLLASLQLDMLRGCLSIRDLRDSLELLPSGIDLLYAVTLERIKTEGHIDLATRVFIWVIYAYRSLSIGELQKAVAVCPETYQFDPERIVDESLLVSVCCGLITVDQESRLVRLVHYTARDYLKPTLDNHSPLPHTVISSTCAAYLLACRFNNRRFREQFDMMDLFQRDPFLDYSYSNWAPHAREHNPISGVVCDFVRQCNNYPIHLRTFYMYTHMDSLNSLHVAASHGLTELLEVTNTAGNKPDINSCTTPGNATALILAAQYGFLQVVKHLLQEDNIDVNAQTIAGVTALMAASSDGFVAIAKSLLEFPGINVNARSVHGLTALASAIDNGHTAIAKALVRAEGIDVNHIGMYGQTPLIKATQFGLPEIVSDLVNATGIKINFSDNFGRTALSHAASSGDLSVVKTLLSVPGIDINSRSNRESAPLKMASLFRHVEVVKTLLAAGAELTEEDLIDETRMGSLEVLDVLLAVEGINVNARIERSYGDGDTMLSAAVRQGPELVERLLQVEGIDVNLAKGRGATPLMEASNHAAPEVVALLLGTVGIQVNAKDDDGRTALWHASNAAPVCTKRRRVVELLLAVPGVRVNIADSRGHTPLAVASLNGSLDIVERLLQFEMTAINSRDRKGKTPLDLAVGANHGEVVQHLRRAGGKTGWKEQGISRLSE
ncbi:ankyrin [Coprinopsis marcescibilis]|uniref:Ankyrin n=1 Tax=Coprinopsis marcescibilis TaxID=230819 RepID=A0A5C3KZB9_COPMA|nr:ankyrin [Coprinopsis marcescibilis]